MRLTFFEKLGMFLSGVAVVFAALSISFFSISWNDVPAILIISLLALAVYFAVKTRLPEYYFFGIFSAVLIAAFFVLFAQVAIAFGYATAFRL